MSPFEFLKAINNPKDYVMNNVDKGNPILNNMIQLAQQGNYKEVENITRNLMKNQGVDFDKEILPLLNNFK